MKIKSSKTVQTVEQSIHKTQQHGIFIGALIIIRECFKSIYTQFIPHNTKQNHLISKRFVSIPNSQSLNTPWIFKASQLQVKSTAELMSSRASIAGLDLLDSILSNNSSSEAYIACNGKEGEEARFAIIGINDGPPHTKTTIEEIQTSITPNDAPMNSLIDDCLWIEFLVADSGSGLGNKLMTEVELIAIEQGKKGLALSAYEFDPKDDDENSTMQPYSIADYYIKKHGFIYTGQSDEELEHDGNGKITSLFYPIYVKPLTNLNIFIQPID